MSIYLDLGPIEPGMSPAEYQARVNEFASELGATCQRCDAVGAKPRRQNTSYVDDRKNWTVYCAECQAEADEFWAEQWREHYGSRL